MNKLVAEDMYYLMVLGRAFKYAAKENYMKRNISGFLHLDIRQEALNVHVDLALHSQVPPCNLTNILPTSLKNEGLPLTQKAVNEQIVQLLEKHFEDAV